MILCLQLLHNLIEWLAEYVNGRKPICLFHRFWSSSLLKSVGDPKIFRYISSLFPLICVWLSQTRHWHDLLSSRINCVILICLQLREFQVRSQNTCNELLMMWAYKNQLCHPLVTLPSTFDYSGPPCKPSTPHILPRVKCRQPHLPYQH